MVTGPAGLGPKNDCAGEGQQQLYRADPFSRQRERPTSTSLQLSYSHNDLKPQMGALFLDGLAD
jgi:hypothetical protein